MKILLSILALLTINLAGFSQEITFEKEVADFGNILQGKAVTNNFSFTNTGNAPLIVQNVQTSCGCTVPEWPKEPVMPGNSAIIKATFNADAMGTFNKAITITSNAKTPTKIIYIKGVVVKELQEKAPEPLPDNKLTLPDDKPNTQEKG